MSNPKSQSQIEQDERIKENVRFSRDRGGFNSYQEFEDAFEDRDPCEFL